MQPSAHEVPSKTPDVPGHDDYTVECPLMTQSGHRSLSGSLSLSSCRAHLWIEGGLKGLTKQ